MAIGSFGKLHFAGRQLGEISSCNGVPLFSSDGRRWIQARTGQIVSFPRLDVPLWHNQQSRHDTIITPASNFDLPDRKVTEEYFSIFCLTAIRHVFPIVDVEVFNCTITAAYKAQGTIPALDHARAKACVLSFLSIVSIMEPAVEASPIDSDACALKAQYLLPQIVVEANIDALQVALMQVSVLRISTSAKSLPYTPVHVQSLLRKFTDCRHVSFAGLPHDVHARRTRTSD